MTVSRPSARVPSTARCGAGSRTWAWADTYGARVSVLVTAAKKDVDGLNTSPPGPAAQTPDWPPSSADCQPT